MEVRELRKRLEILLKDTKQYRLCIEILLYAAVNESSKNKIIRVSDNYNNLLDKRNPKLITDKEFENEIKEIVSQLDLLIQNLKSIDVAFFYDSYLEPKIEQLYQSNLANIEEYEKNDLLSSYIEPDYLFRSTLSGKVSERPISEHIINEFTVYQRNDRRRRLRKENLFIVEGEAGFGKTRFCFNMLMKLPRSSFYIAGEYLVAEDLENSFSLLQTINEKIKETTDLNLIDIEYLFIDGWDEIVGLLDSPSKNYISTIIDFSNKINGTSIVITSRPDFFRDRIKGSIFYSLQPLQSEHQIEFIKAFKKKNETSIKLLQVLKRDSISMKSFQEVSRNPALLSLILDSNLLKANNLNNENKAKLCREILVKKYQIATRSSGNNERHDEEWLMYMQELARIIYLNEDDSISKKDLDIILSKQSIFEKIDTDFLRLHGYLNKVINSDGENFEIRPRLIYEYLIAQELISKIREIIKEEKGNITILLQASQIRLGKRVYSSNIWSFIEDILQEKENEDIMKNFVKKTDSLEYVLSKQFLHSLREENGNLPIEQAGNIFYGFWKLFRLCNQERRIKGNDAIMLMDCLYHFRNVNENSKVVFSKIDYFKTETIRGKNIDNIDFTDSDLSSNSFENCSFENCDFLSTKLDNTLFRYCNLSKCKFSETLKNTRFYQCEFGENKFSNIIFQDVKFVNCFFTNREEKSLFESFEVVNHLSFEQCVLNKSMFISKKPIDFFEMIRCDVSDSNIELGNVKIDSLEDGTKNININLEDSNLSSTLIDIQGIKAKDLFKASNLTNTILHIELKREIANNRIHAPKLGYEELKKLNPKHPFVISVDLENLERKVDIPSNIETQSEGKTQDVYKPDRFNKILQM